jgi:hypothetical protein
LMGFMLADPMVGSNMMVVGGAMFALLIPIILAVHQRALIWLTGAFINCFFLPGQPQMWMVVAAMSFTILILSRPLRKVKMQPTWDKAVFVTLTLFMVAVAITAAKSGGIGLRVLGSSVYGGKKYVSLIASFIGFLALTLQALPRKHAQKDVSIWALSPATSAISNIVYMLGPSFYFLYLLFPVEMAYNQAAADYSPALGTIKRFTGFSSASSAIIMFCLLRWGIKGTLKPSKPWRLGLVVVGFAVGMLSGFRSAILGPVIIMIVQFFAEGLHKTKYALGLAGFGAACIIFLAAFSESLPLAAQRAISFLPVRVDPVAAMDAKGSLSWRVEMWKVVVKDIPHNLWFGKGYAIDPTDIYLSEESVKRGFESDYDLSARAGDYHSGPLSVLIPFGVFGAVTVTLFLIAAVRLLYRNLKSGDADVKNINIFLFSYFVGQSIYFVFLFGGIETDLWVFVSTVGISCAINSASKYVPQRKEPVRHTGRGKRVPDSELVTA